MGQKVNPISLRLQQTNRFFDSCWYSDYFYVDLIARDLQIQYYLNTVLKQVNYPSARFFIQNLPKKTEITFFFYSPTPFRKIRAKAYRLRQYKRRKPRRKKSFYVISNKLFFKVVQKAYTPHGLKKRPKARRFIKHFFRRRKRLIKHLLRRRKRLIKHLIKFERFVSYDTASYNFLRKQFYFRYLLVLEYLIKQCSSFGWGKLKFKILKEKINEEETNINEILLKGKNKDIIRIKIGRIYSKYKKITKKLKEERPLFHKEAEITRSNWVSNLFSNLVVRLRLYQNQNAVATIKPYFLTCNEHVEYVLSKQLKTQVNLSPKKEQKDFKSALFLAEEIVHFLERRVPFRKIKNRIFNELKKIEKMKEKFGEKIPKKSLKYINSPHIKGVRILYSGRIGGRSKKALRAKTECFKYGQTSLNVFSSCIEFASKNALTRFGLGGVKVWVCHSAQP